MTSRTLDRNITVLGSPSVGKSALTIRYLENRFEDDYVPTLVKRNIRTIDYNGNSYRLTILDTAGLERYSAIPNNYITSSDGYILVYSITDEQSFQTIQDIYNRLIEAHNRSIPLVLVGNKIDLSHDRRVDRSEGENLAHKWHAPFIETSAKIGDNVNDIFRSCLSVIDSSLNGSTRTSNIITSKEANINSNGINHLNQMNQSNNNNNSINNNNTTNKKANDNNKCVIS